MLYLCDNQALLKAVKRWVGEGRKATLGEASDADILRDAIEELRKRATTGASTFVVKVKAHRGDQAKGFPWNCTTGQVEQSSHGKSLARKDVVGFYERKSTWNSGVQKAIR